MSNVYIEKPNIVTIQMSDATGTAERFVVGKSLDEVIAIIQPETPCGESKPKKKDRKPRRTKAEIAAAKDAEVDSLNEKNEGRSAGEAAMDRLKQEAAAKGKQGPTETVWP